MVTALVVTPLLAQRGAAPPRPPWVLETRNVVSLDVPAAVRGAIKWDGFDPAVPIGAVADLNGDGSNDYFLKGTSESCGTGGCPYVIIDGKSATVIGNVWGNPLVVRTQGSNGFPDIDVYSRGSASSGSFTSYAFDGRQYAKQSSRSVAGAEVTALFAALDKIQRWPPAQLGQVSLFEGRWRTDIPPNRKDMSAPVISGIGFAVTSERVTITDYYLRPDGRSEESSNVYQTDGEPHPGAKPRNSLPDSTLIARWSGQDRLDVVFIVYDVGLETIHFTYSISKDRKTLSVRGVYSGNGHIYEKTFYR